MKCAGRPAAGDGSASVTPSPRIYAALILAACYSMPGASAADGGGHPSLSPAQDFSNQLFIILSPNSQGWVGLNRSSAGISFGRVGSSPTDSDIAAVTLFSVPAGLSPEDFLAYIKDGVERDAHAPRFEATETRVKLSQARSYPCVEYQANSIDHVKQFPLLPSKALPLRISGLYCQYPNKPGLGFSISFSHRGADPLPTFDAEAQDFIASVEVTSPPARPNPHSERP
jgi:hypothetical protein